MKTLYTILFFFDAILLVFLSFDLFSMIDKSAGAYTISFIICGMAVCIALLAFFLLRYIRQPFSRKDN